MELKKTFERIRTSFSAPEKRNRLLILVGVIGVLLLLLSEAPGIGNGSAEPAEADGDLFSALQESTQRQLQKLRYFDLSLASSATIFLSNLCVATPKNRFSRIPPKQIITQWLVYQIWPVKPLFVYQNGHPLAPNSTTNQHEFYTQFVF